MEQYSVTSNIQRKQQQYRHTHTHTLTLSLYLEMNLINYYHAHIWSCFGKERETEHHAMNTRQISNSSVGSTRLIYDTAIFFWKFITKFIFNQHNVLNELSISVSKLGNSLHRIWCVKHWRYTSNSNDQHERDKKTRKNYELLTYLRLKQPSNDLQNEWTNRTAATTEFIKTYQKKLKW